MTGRYFESLEDSCSEDGQILVTSETAKPQRKRSKRCPICVKEELNHVCVNMRCSECFATGHFRANCPKKNTTRCAVCGTTAHSKDKCVDAHYTAALRIIDFKGLTCLYCFKPGHINCFKFPGPLPLRCFVCCERGHGGRECRDRPKHLKRKR